MYTNLPETTLADIGLAKLSYFRKLNPRDTKKFWKAIKFLSKKPKSVPILALGDVTASTEGEKADLLNAYFTPISIKHTPHYLPLLNLVFLLHLAQIYFAQKKKSMTSWYLWTCPSQADLTDGILVAYLWDDSASRVIKWDLDPHSMGIPRGEIYCNSLDKVHWRLARMLRGCQWHAVFFYGFDDCIINWIKHYLDSC